MKQVGDIVFVEATGDFYPGIECIVMEVSQDDGRITKMKSTIQDDRLAKLGFIIEGEDFIVQEWHYSAN